MDPKLSEKRSAKETAGYLSGLLDSMTSGLSTSMVKDIPILDNEATKRNCQHVEYSCRRIRMSVIGMKLVVNCFKSHLQIHEVTDIECLSCQLIGLKLEDLQCAAKAFFNQNKLSGTADISCTAKYRLPFRRSSLPMDGKSGLDGEGINKLGGFYEMRDNFAEFSNLALHNILHLRMVDRPSVFKLKTLLQELNNLLYFDVDRLRDFQFASSRYAMLKAIHQKIITYVEQLAQKENHLNQGQQINSTTFGQAEQSIGGDFSVKLLSPKLNLRARASEEKRFYEMLDQLKFVVSSIVMAYGNLCEMRSFARQNPKKCLDRNSSYEWRCFETIPEPAVAKYPETHHYDELPCKHAKEVDSPVNCSDSKISSLDGYWSPGKVEELTNKVKEWRDWVTMQLEAIERLKKGKIPVQSEDELNRKIEEISESYGNATELVRDLLKHCDMVGSDYPEGPHDVEQTKHLQDLIDQSNRLKQGWSSLSQCLTNLKGNVLQALRHLEELSSQERMLESLLDQTEAQTVSNPKTIDGNAVISIPQQIEFNASLLQNLNDQECLLKRLNELFDELKEVDISGEYGTVSLSKVRNLNGRWRDLTTSLSNRINALRNILEVSPVTLNVNSFDMAGSVDLPWKRIVAANEYPYYANTRTFANTWDHPHMTIMMESLCRYNDIRFCAYRTSMKLRAFQRWLLLDMCDLQNISTAFTGELVNAHSAELISQDNEFLSVSRLMTILRRMYEVAAAANAIPVNIPRATDLCLNWLILLYDPRRKKELKPFECQIAVVMMCRAPIEEKYGYIFDICASMKPTMSLSMLRRFIAASLAIPLWLGEVDAFGGKDPEPSVRSFMDHSPKGEITREAFLAWVRLEPQSLVWLPVLHRLAASEDTRHEAKCNICKEYPIIGFRYRSLRRFNFDVCQKCFFLGRSAIELNFDDPLQEYYIETTSSDDIRDFFKIFANKFKRDVRVKTKLGYLPISKRTSSRSSTGSESPDSLKRRASFPSFPNGSQSSNPLMPPVFDNDQLCGPMEDSEEHSAVASYCRILSEHKVLETDGLQMPVSSQKESFPSSSRVDKHGFKSLKAPSKNRGLQTNHFHGGDDFTASKTTSATVNSRLPPALPLGAKSPNKLDLENQGVFEDYRQRLENRLSCLEEHNAKLEHQLHQVRRLIRQRQMYAGQEAPGNSSIGITPRSTVSPSDGQAGKDTAAMGRSSPFPSINKSRQAISNLFHCADDINKAVGSLVSLMAKDVKVTNNE